MPAVQLVSCSITIYCFSQMHIKQSILCMIHACCCHQVVLLLSCSHSPCTHHVLTMFSPCIHHVLTMYTPCTHHPLTIYSRCQHHAASLSPPGRCKIFEMISAADISCTCCNQFMILELQRATVGESEGWCPAHVSLCQSVHICWHHQQGSGCTDRQPTCNCQIRQRGQHLPAAWSDDIASHWCCCIWVSLGSLV